jgi:hypothetical protein
VPRLNNTTIIAAFKEVFSELKAKGYEPTFNVIDNQATGPRKAFLKT